MLAPRLEGTKPPTKEATIRGIITFLHFVFIPRIIALKDIVAVLALEDIPAVNHALVRESGLLRAENEAAVTPTWAVRGVGIGKVAVVRIDVDKLAKVALAGIADRGAIVRGAVSAYVGATYVAVMVERAGLSR